MGAAFRRGSESIKGRRGRPSPPIRTAPSYPKEVDLPRAGRIPGDAETFSQIPILSHRVLFQRGTNISQAIDIIGQEFQDSAELREIIDFVKSSDKGIINRG